MATPNDWDIITGEDPDAQGRMLADLLRRRQAAGQLTGLVGGRYFAPWGGEMDKSAGEDLRKLAMVAQVRRDERTGRESAAAQARANEAKAAEDRRRWEEEMGLKRRQLAEGRGDVRIVIGEGGAQYVVDPRQPGRPAQALIGPDGKPLVKPRGNERPIPPAEKNLLQDLTAEYRALEDLGARFKPAFAGGGPLGGVSTSLYQKLGSVGSKGMQEDAAFWADFSRLIDLPQRNRIFGASLTLNEKIAWDQAKNIRPGSDPRLVAEQLAKMSGIYKQKLQEHGQALAAEGFNPEAIRSISGGIVNPGGGETQRDKPPEQRMAELVGEGISEEEAIRIMEQEGY